MAANLLRGSRFLSGVAKVVCSTLFQSGLKFVQGGAKEAETKITTLANGLRVVSQKVFPFVAVANIHDPSTRVELPKSAFLSTTEAAMKTLKPTGMREIFLNTPGAHCSRTGQLIEKLAFKGTTSRKQQQLESEVQFFMSLI